VASRVLSLAPLRYSFRALRHRNFRLFIAGQFVSLIGTWMQSIALGWLLFRLTGSAALLGVSGFLAQIPSLFVSPVAGVWADRWQRHRMVIGTQVLSLVQAALLAALVLSGRETVHAILALSLFIGLVNSVDVPARQSFVVEMVGGSEDLPNAIALNSSVFNVARLIGPSIGGLLIGPLGEGMLFLVNALSYVAVIAALLAIRVPPAPAPRHAEAALWPQLREGLAYVGGFRTIRSLLLLLGLVSLLGQPFSVLLPAFTGKVLHGDADTLGLLVAAVGVGALVGALYLASRTTVVGLGRLIVTAVTVFGVGLILLALVRSRWLALPILACCGFGMMVHMGSSNTIVQTVVDPEKRGRVMSIYAVSFMGTAPLGSLFEGWLADRIGIPWTVALGGVATLAGGLLFARELPALRAQLRPIYRRLGVLPEVASGLQATEEAAAEVSPQ
jgi:MFS family permease